MSSGYPSEPRWKSPARQIYRHILSLHSWLSGCPAEAGTRSARLFYGGARAGDGGGPLVKVKKLREFFPEDRWQYNLVYVLSNAPYLPATALRRLKERRIPIVLNQNGVFYPGWYPGDWRAENRRMAHAHRLADHVFYQSEFCRRSAEQFLGPRQGPGEVLYNAVDTKRFVPSGRAWSGERPFVLLLAGKVAVHQAYRISLAIEGMAEARRKGLDSRLVVAGLVAREAEQAARLRASQLNIGDCVTYTGAYRQDEAPALFATADGYVMLNHNDACPSTVIEAMAAGLPILFARSGGVPELVGAEAGIGLETGQSFEQALRPSAEAVGDAILTLAERSPTLSAAARRRAVALFDIEQWIGRHRELFTLLLQSSHG